MDGGVGAEEGDQQAREQRIPRHRRLSAPGAERLVAAGERDGGNRQQKGETRGRLARETQREPRGHGDAGAGRARDQGQRLGGADQQRVAQAHVRDAPRAASETIAAPQHQGEHQGRGGDDRGAADDATADGRESKPAEADRNRRQQQEPDHAAVANLPARRQRAQPVAAHAAQIGAKVGEHREQRAHVHGDVEGQALVGPVDDDGQQDEVRGARDGQELGEPLEHRQHDHLNPFHRPSASR